MNIRPIVPLTRQEVFDNALNGVRAQGYLRSMTPNGEKCVYRGQDGRKCGVGHSIPDDMYHPDMDEGSGWDSTIRRVMMKHAGIATLFSLCTPAFLAEIQEAHDRRLKSGKFWFEERMRGIASENGLTYTPPEVKA